VGNSIGLVLLSVVCGVSGQLVLKIGMTQFGRIGADALAEPMTVAWRVLTNPLVMLGLGCYALGAIFWLTVLSRVPLSLAYPTLALTYVAIPLLAWLLLGESISLLRWAGIGVICAGVLLVVRS
jgi:drug/metabolite transporter (DMT)-like permease